MHVWNIASIFRVELYSVLEFMYGFIFRKSHWVKRGDLWPVWANRAMCLEIYAKKYRSFLGPVHKKFIVRMCLHAFSRHKHRNAVSMHASILKMEARWTFQHLCCVTLWMNPGVGPRDSPSSAEKTKISCLCWESNPNFSVVHTVAFVDWSLLASWHYFKAKLSL